MLLLVLLAGCVAPRKPCQVERICYQHKSALVTALSTNLITFESALEMRERRAMMTDILKTIAELEQEAGRYK